MMPGENWINTNATSRQSKLLRQRPALKPIGFEMLSGTTLEQARTLVEAMNERIVGVAVTPK
jgi:hypothetical protein